MDQELLSDADVAAAKAFGLAFKMDDATITKYKGFGMDLNIAHTDPDYRKRLAVNTILKELRDETRR